MTQIGWNESVISIVSTVGSFPAYAKSVWTAISTGMGVEHFWDGTGGASAASRGELKPGGPRSYVALQSASSFPSQGTGRLFFASDVSRLLAYASAGTYMVGTPFFSDESTGVATPALGVYRLRQSGGTSCAAGVTTTFKTPYVAAPILLHATSSATSVSVVCFANGLTGFSPGFKDPTGNALSGTYAFTWEALGYASMSSV